MCKDEKGVFMKKYTLIFAITTVIITSIVCVVLVFSNENSKKMGTIMIQGSDRPQIKAKHNPENWNIGVKPKKTKPYTLLIYLNGSTLESRGMGATKDILELLEANIDTSEINIVLHTGGTSWWNNNRISEQTNALYQIQNNKLNLLKEVGLLNMGATSTLRDFLDFGVTNYPAEQYLFLFWGHAGAVELGYGYDENFEGDTLLLDEMHSAFEQANLPPKIFDLIAFDTCLMANIETAQAVQGYAKYLLASQGLTPGRGLDYRWVKILSDQPGFSMVSLGQQIIKAFTQFYIGTDIGSSSTTLSLLDLSLVDKVTQQLDQLANTVLQTNKGQQIQDIRKTLPTYGEQDAYGGNSNMVDLTMLLRLIEPLAPTQVAAALDVLSDMVLFFENSQDMNFSNGISVYFPE